MPITITTESIPGVVFNTSYEPFTLEASGGIPPYTWGYTVDDTYPPLDFVGVDFPPGLSLTPDGVISLHQAQDLVAGNYNLTLMTTDSTGSSSAPEPLLLTVSCGEQLDPISNLYRAFPVTNKGSATLLTYVGPGDQFIPACSSFTQTAHSALYPSTADFLVGESYSWALVRSPITLPAADSSSLFSPGVGLDTWVSIFLNTSNQAILYGNRTITSGYRDPKYQYSISPKYPNGRHTFGDAIDLRNNSWGTSQSQSEYNAMRSAALAAGASYVEPWSLVNNSINKGHEHADWRNIPGPYQQ
jgi:hypothetical protein